MEQPINIPGITVDVYENHFLDKNYVLILKEQRAIIVGDYYTYLFKTMPFTEAIDYCIQIAKSRIFKP